MKVWMHDDAFVQRAVVAGLCEPPILKTNAEIVQVLEILDGITSSMALSSDRRSDGFRVLRQALGYGWSVAAAAAPENAMPYLQKWLQSKDKDVAWIMQNNLGKSRMSSLRDALARPAPGSRSGSRAK
jgi:hypothetical protein